MTEFVDILIVDDEPDNLQAIVDIFKQSQLPYKITKAPNGVVALKIIEKKIPHLIITDWDMPEMNGIDFIKNLKLNSVTKNIPVIMCTGIMTSSDNLRTALDAGAVDYIRKPVDKIELIARTNSMLKLAQSYDRIKSQADILEKALLKLRELDKFKQGMVNSIVHDLKNPLNVILNIIEFEKGINSLALIKRVGQQMLTMVLNILEVHKFEEAKISLENTHFSIFSVAQKVVEELIFLTEQRYISIKNHISPKYSVLADRRLVERIYHNLLSNAIKHTPVNGNIALECSEVIENNATFLKLFVSDSGEGVPADKVNQVFDKFVSFDKTESGKSTSTGLGLTFCKMAVEAHGGKIGVQSKNSKHNIFWFTLPKGNEIILETQIETPKESLLEKMFLSEEEKNVIKPFILELRDCEFYEISAIRNVIKNLNVENPNIKKWKKNLEKAVFNSNEQVYNELLSV